MRVELSRIEEAPECGNAMICFRTSLYYGKFQRSGQKIIIDYSETEDKILELHLFDSETEYRAVYSESRERYIETVVKDASEKFEKKIKEECYLLPEYQEEKIGVANYMCFDENDMLYLSNYRLYVVRGNENE